MNDFEERYTGEQYISDTGDWHQTDSRWKADQIAAILDKTTLSTISRVCEIGCGAGGVISELQKRLEGNKTYVGYDIAPIAIKMARQKSNQNLEFQCKTIHDIDEEFDLILLIDVFEHIPDFMTFLEQCKGKADKFIFHIPLDLSAKSVLLPDFALNRRSSVGHLHQFTVDTALAALQECGFKIVKRAYTASGYVNLSRGRIRTVLDIPGKLLFHLNPDLAARLIGRRSLLVLAEPCQN